MCMAVDVVGGPRIEGADDLGMFVGRHNVVEESPGFLDAVGWNSCLCVVDVPATFRSLGYHVTNDALDYIVSAPAPAESVKE